MSGSFIEDDLGIIFNQKEFGVTGGCVWNGITITDVIFDDEDVEVSLGDGPVQIVEQPMLSGRTIDFPAIQSNDSIMVSGETFRVKNWQKDGTGVIEIFLERTS